MTEDQPRIGRPQKFDTIKRMSISLPDDLFLAVIQTASRNQTSRSSVVREALESHFKRQQPQK